MSAKSPSKSVVVGSGQFRYEASNTWHHLPEGWVFVEAVGVAVDSQDRVYVYNRGEHPVIVFDADGNFLYAWGEGKFVRPHGIFIGPDDTLYLTDDLDHTIRRYTTEGKLLMTLGTSGVASDTGCVNSDYRTIKRPGGPFNQPTNLALAPNGEMFISDGYGNCEVHRFTPEGELIQSWGTPGTGPGQFQLVHGIGVDSAGRVFVADRENSRLQLFTPEGEFLEEWTDVVRPTDVYFDLEDRVYVAEIGWRVGIDAPRPYLSGGRVSIFDSEGNLLSRWGGGQRFGSPGDFVAPHDVWLDSQGSIYIGEVTWSAAGKRGLVSADCPSLQKFVRCS